MISPIKPLVIVLLGPTASGKTALAIDIAEKMQLAIHNVDSRQLYVGMDIGTAKPTQKQLKSVAHHLIDLRQPNNPITLKEFHQEAELSLQNSFKSKQMGFLVGGSGLYLKAITRGLQPPAVAPQPQLRKQLNEIGQKICYQLLKNADKEAAKRIGQADVVRTQRALEVIYSTGLPISTQQGTKPPPWNVLEIGLDPKDLRKRIMNRTLEIYSKGLVEETKILSNQFGADLPMLQTIGYREALDILQGKSTTAEAIAITTRRTQQFAKRQRTWFRRQHHPHWLNEEEPLKEALSLIEDRLGCTKQTNT